VSAILSVPGRIVDVLLFPFEQLPALAGLALIACLAAVGALLVMKLTSDQIRLAAVRQAIQAAMYEIWLFRADVRAMWRAVGEVARLNATYIRLSIVPALWMVVPFVLLIAHLQAHYGYRALDVGRPALLKVTVTSDPGDARPRASAPAGLRIDTPAVWIPSLREFAWRIVPDQPGDYDVTVAVADAVMRAKVEVAAASATSWPLRATRVENLSVTYPRGGIAILGHSLHWSIPFVAITAACAWLLRRPFRVTL
jgi:hypothetical protein